MMASEFWGSFIAGLLSGFLINITLGILLAIFTGILASLVFFLSLLLIKPRIKISKELALEILDDGKYKYRVKVVNLTHSMITNLRYNMMHSEVVSEDINHNIEITHHRSPLPVIPAYKRKEGYSDYAVRLSYVVDPKEVVLNDSTSSLIFTLIADHPISNTTTCIRKQYYLKDIIEGTFETCESTKIINKKAIVTKKGPQ